MFNNNTCHLIQISLSVLFSFLIVSCDQFSRKSINSPENKTTNTVLIIESNPAFELTTKPRIGYYDNKPKFLYLNKLHEEVFIYPKVSSKNDTIILSNELEEYFLSGFYFIHEERFLYPIQKGDTVVMSMKSQMPFLTKLNKPYDSLAFNYGYYETLALRNDSIDFGPFLSFKYSSQKREKYRKDYTDLLLRKKAFLDSLAIAKRIDSSVYYRELYLQAIKRKEVIEAFPEKYHSEIRSFRSLLPGNPSKETIVNFHHLVNDFPKDMRNLSSRPFRKELLKQSYDTIDTDFYIRTPSSKILDYPRIYRMIDSSNQIDSLTRKVLLSNTFYKIVENFSGDTSSFYFEKLKKEVDIDQVNHINDKYLIDVKHNISDSTDLQFTGQNRNLTSLNDIIKRNENKLIYIDLWASWCRPCIEELPSAKKLISKYRDEEFEYLFVSLDKNVEKWKNALTDHKISQYKNNYLALNPNDSEIFRSFNVTSIPRYILLYPDGTIEEDAPGPSSAILDQMIQEHLN